MNIEMRVQIVSFLEYFTSIKNGSNKKIKDSKIDTIIFNPEFFNAFVEKGYMNKNIRQFQGYPVEIDYNKSADYWGMCLSPIK